MESETEKRDINGREDEGTEKRRRLSSMSRMWSHGSLALTIVEREPENIFFDPPTHKPSQVLYH